MNRKRKISLLGAGALCVLALPWIVPFFSPHSRINREDHQIDLASGTQRIRKYLYWIPVTSSVQATAVSTILSTTGSGEMTPQWHPVSTYGPYTKHSPHYGYHGVFRDIRRLESIWEDHDFPQARREATASILLDRWRLSGSGHGGSEYLRSLANMPFQNSPGLQRP